MAPILEGKSIGSRPKNSAKRRAPDFGEPRIRLGTKVQSNSRIQSASNQSKLVPRKLDPGPSSKVGLSLLTILIPSESQKYGNNILSYLQSQPI
jgi:hypothetical protein